jgi:hypothetical protein
MTDEQFNDKYEQFLEKGHYGLDIGIPEFVEWLDQKFQEFIKVPGFSYSQIKAKFWMGRFYCKNLLDWQIKEVEDKITELCKKN